MVARKDKQCIVMQQAHHRHPNKQLSGGRICWEVGPERESYRIMMLRQCAKNARARTPPTTVSKKRSDNLREGFAILCMISRIVTTSKISLVKITKVGACWCSGRSELQSNIGYPLLRVLPDFLLNVTTKIPLAKDNLKAVYIFASDYP